MDNNKVDPKNKTRANSQKRTNKRFSVIKAIRKQANKLILENHNSDQDTVYRKTANDIVYNEKSHIVAVFKDYLIYDDTSEFLKRFYNINETKFRLPKYLEYYEVNSKIFPNYIKLQESKYLYRNIKRKQRMIDNIQKYESDKKRKKENEETMIFNTQIIDYILNQTSICDSQTNINLNNSFNNKNKHLLNKKVIIPVNKPSNLNHNVNSKNINNNLKNQQTKDKNGNNNNNNNNLNLNTESKNNYLKNNKENKGDVNSNNIIDPNKNLDIFSKFEKLNNNVKLKNTNFNPNHKTKSEDNLSKKAKGQNEEKSFVSMEFLIEAIDKAEKIVDKNPQTYRETKKLMNNLYQESNEKLKQNPTLHSHRGVFSSKLSGKNQADINGGNPENNAEFSNETTQLQEKNNKILNPKESQNSRYRLNDKVEVKDKNHKDEKSNFNSNNENCKKTNLKTEKNSSLNAKQKQNQIENASTFNTAEPGNSNLTVKNKKYLTRNEIILNNLLSKNSLNKETKTTNSSNNHINNKNNLIGNNTDYDANFVINKNQEQESPIAKQRRKLEKELNLCNTKYDKNKINNDIYNNREAEEAIDVKQNMNKQEISFLDSQNALANIDLIDFNYEKENNNKNNLGNHENAENFQNDKCSLSRNLLIFNCISTINNPSTDKKGLLSEANKPKDNSAKLAALPLNSEANRLLQSSSQLYAQAEKPRIYSSSKKMSALQREKESQLLINKLNSHNHFGASKNNGNYNTNILSARENFNLKILFNKTKIDFDASKGKLNSHRHVSQNSNNANSAKKKNLNSATNEITNKNNTQSKNTNANENPNYPNQHSDQNLIKTENNLNPTNKINQEGSANTDLANNNLNEQKRLKIILQGGGNPLPLSKDEIKISSYRSKENILSSNNNFNSEKAGGVNYKINNFNKSNNMNNTNTARELSKQAKSGLSLLNSENFSAINNNNNINFNNSKFVNTRKTIFSPINQSKKFIAGMSPRQSTPEKDRAHLILEDKLMRNYSSAFKKEKNNKSYKSSSLINFSSKNIPTLNNSKKFNNSNLNLLSNNNSQFIGSQKARMNNNLEKKENHKNFFSENYPRKGSNGKHFPGANKNPKISNAAGNGQTLGSHRTEKNGNFLYNILGNAVKPHEAEFKILSARLSRKGAVPGTAVARLRDPVTKSIENFATKNFLKEKIYFNPNNTKTKTTGNTGVNLNLNLQNSNSNVNLFFNHSLNGSIKFNVSHKNKSGVKTNFNTISNAKINAVGVCDDIVSNENFLNKNNSNKNPAEGGISGKANKIKGIQIKNFNQILQNKFTTAAAKGCYSNSDRVNKSNKKV